MRAVRGANCKKWAAGVDFVDFFGSLWTFYVMPHGEFGSSMPDSGTHYKGIICNQNYPKIF